MLAQTDYIGDRHWNRIRNSGDVVTPPILEPIADLSARSAAPDLQHVLDIGAILSCAALYVMARIATGASGAASALRRTGVEAANAGAMRPRATGFRLALDRYVKLKPARANRYASGVFPDRQVGPPTPITATRVQRMSHPNRRRQLRARAHVEASRPHRENGIGERGSRNRRRAE